MKLTLYKTDANPALSAQLEANLQVLNLDAEIVEEAFALQHDQQIRALRVRTIPSLVAYTEDPLQLVHQDDNPSTLFSFMQTAEQRLAELNG